MAPVVRTPDRPTRGLGSVPMSGPDLRYLEVQAAPGPAVATCREVGTVSETPEVTAPRTAHAVGTDRDQQMIAWLESEFPGWSITVDETATWRGLRPIWIARCEGHHPQAELTAAKLHTRLTEHLEREGGRTAMSN